MQPSRLEPAEVVLQFFRYLDDQDYELIPELFSDDGVWHRRGVATNGPAQVRQSLADVPPVMPTVHLVTNLQVERVSPHEAHAVFYVTVFRSAADESRASPPWPMELPLMLTLYKVHLVKVANEWLFKAIRNDPIFRR
jgi:limonene-1,2-epoxide hydrolase